MGSNPAYIKSPQGIVKTVASILCIIVVALSTFGHFGSEHKGKNEEGEDLEVANTWKEIVLVAISAFVALIGTLGLLAHLCSQALLWDKRTAFVDFGFYMIAALGLCISGTGNVTSAVEVYDSGCTADNDCQQWLVKLGAGGLAMIAGVIHGIAGVLVYTNRNEVER